MPDIFKKKNSNIFPEPIWISREWLKKWLIYIFIVLPQIIVKFIVDVVEQISELMRTPEFQIFIASLLKIVCLLIAVAYFTIAERKVMGAIQRRRGPNVVGFWGLLQPLADGAKLIFKEILIPTRANRIIFLMAPIMVLILSMVSWSLIPSGLEETPNTLEPKTSAIFPSFTLFYHSWKENTIYEILNYVAQNFLPGVSTTVDIDYGVLFILAISGLNVYGIIIAGWASNSKYAFLGALRSAAQMISYEVSLGLLILPVVFLAGSLNLSEIVIAQEQTVWFFSPLVPCVVMFFISMLAETNRAPFDLPEAEAELVAGYNVEYSSIIFAMFFLGEYSNMLLMATLVVLFFFGAWLAPIELLNFIPGSVFFSFKTVLFCSLFILVRAAYPRYRYDQLMDLGWKTFLPISLSFLVFITGLLVALDACPQVLEITPAPYTEFFFFAPGSENLDVITNPVLPQKEVEQPPSEHKKKDCLLTLLLSQFIPLE
jgi:NADH-quinone oxidoreductase subunit H